jgi:hypothetical protein
MHEKIKELLIEFNSETGNFGKNYKTGEYSEEFIIFILKQCEVQDDHK